MDFIFPARLPLALLLLLPAAVEAQSMRNSAFNIQYSDEGIVSLRHTCQNDVTETEDTSLTAVRWRLSSLATAHLRRASGAISAS